MLDATMMSRPRSCAVDYAWDELPRLTPRELQVLTQACEGRLDRDISASLAITHKTIENHLRSIYAKWGVLNRAQAIVMALKFGVVRPPWLNPAPSLHDRPASNDANCADLR